MPVYDDEKEKIDSKPGHHDDLGVHPEHREAEVDDLENKFNAPSYSRDAIADREEAANKQEPGRAADKEAGALSDKIGGGYQDEGRPLRERLRGGLTRRRLIGGGVIGGGVGVVVSLFAIFSGPLEIIHFAQLLQKFHFSNNEEFLDGRTGRYFRNWVRNKNPANARLGYIGNKYANKWEARMNRDVGLRSVYHPQTGRLIGYEVIDAEKAKDVLNDLEDEEINTRESFPGQRLDGSSVPQPARMVDLRDEKFRNRRSVTRSILRGTNTRKIASTIGSRFLIRRAGVDFHPLKNVQRKASDNFLEWKKKRKEEREQRRKNGAINEDGGLTGTEDEEGNRRNDGEAGEGNSWETEAKDADTPAKRRSLIKKLGGLAAALCIVHGIGKEVPAYKHANIILPLIRLGTEMVTTGNQVMSGDDVNAEELGTIMEDLYDEETQTSWAAARSIQYELGEEPTGRDIDPNARPGNVTQKPLIFRIVDNPIISGVCGATNILSSIPIIGNIIDLGDRLINGAINFLLTPFGFTIDDFFLAIVKFFAGDGVASNVAGADLGNNANYGARLAANDQAIAFGGRELSDAEVAQLDSRQSEFRKHDQKQKSFAGRMFNVYDRDSLASHLLGTRDVNFSSSMSKLASNLQKGNFFASFAKTFTRPFTKPAHAAGTYDYEFPEFGFSIAEIDNPAYEDPFANAAWVEEEVDPVTHRIRLQDLNEKYGNKCFAMTVDVNTGYLVSGDAKKAYSDVPPQEGGIPPECKDPNNEELTRYRFYLADVTVEQTLGCYEGEEEICNYLNFGGSAGGTTLANCVTDIEEPPNDYERVNVGGHTLNKRTKHMLDVAQGYFSEGGGGQFVILQGSYNTSVGASAGTHAGGGAIDFSVNGMSGEQINIAIRALRRAGFAAWFRPMNAEWISHIHVIAIGDKEMAAAAASQVDQYFDGKNGLADHGPDPHADIGRPIPSWALEYGEALCP